MNRRPSSALPFVALVALLGCNGAPPANRAPAHARTSPGWPEATPAPGADASTSDTSTASAPASSTATTAASPDAATATPSPVERTGKVWPFHAWDRAEAVTFNRFAMRPDVPLRAYDERGWSPHLADRKRMTWAQAKRAFDLVAQTRGDVMVSKCPFPRHAVVLFDGDVAVASVNVCFSCGDILLWPRWSAEPDWEKLTKKERAELERRTNEQLVAYDEAFPRWKTFFRDDIGFAIDDAP
ncbi:MAG: hypothetical protein KF894_31860 [Labilithrix sp.]|nr:hypothetical protein [Labilithrix sp.]